MWNSWNYYIHLAGTILTCHNFRHMKRQTSGSFAQPNLKRQKSGQVFNKQPTKYVAPRRAPAESGFVDTALAAYNFDTTGSIALLSTIPQGSSVNQRVGKKVHLRSLQCRGNVANNATATFNDCAILIVRDVRPTGALPAITDILVSATASSLNNDANSGRFQILRRLDFELIGNATSLTEAAAKSSDFYLALNNKLWVAKALGTGTIADSEEGPIYIVTVGSGVAGTAAATAYLNFRLRFVDY